MPRLNVNIDHVATIREARKCSEPDPVLAAYVAELAGAEGIVVHLREDRRHIQDRDLLILRKTVKTKLNLEMAPTGDMINIALDVRPDMVTLVPEKRQEITTEGGLDVLRNPETVAHVINEIQTGGIFVSVFIDPDVKQIELVRKAGAEMVEIHTGNYANARNDKGQENEFIKIREAVEYSKELGLRVAAGHGLNYTNVRKVSNLKGIEELNIGHSIIANAVIVGIEKAVRDMVALCR